MEEQRILQFKRVDPQIYEKEKIKYTKKKTRKEVTVIECVLAFEKFLAIVRFQILLLLNELEEVNTFCGYFPPYLRFNIDQYPLPLVVSQDSTFTIETDNDTHIKCPNKALQKRQFIMHIVFNTRRRVRKKD